MNISPQSNLGFLGVDASCWGVLGTNNLQKQAFGSDLYSIQSPQVQARFWIFGSVNLHEPAFSWLLQLIETNHPTWMMIHSNH